MRPWVVCAVALVLAFAAQPAAAQPAAEATAAEAPAAAAPAAAVPRFTAPVADTSDWLPADIFTPQDLALAAQQPVLRVALAAAGQPPYVRLDTDGQIKGVQAELLVALAARLRLRLVPVVLADEAAVQQSLQAGTADLQLLARPTASARADTHLSLGTGALPLGLFALGTAKPVPMPRARVAVIDTPEASSLGGGRAYLFQYHPGATPVQQPDALKALQAVASQSADIYLGELMPALDALSRQAVAGLELRQVLTGAAGHLHFALSDRHAALLPVLNKGIIAWRSTALGHQALMRAAHDYAGSLRQPLALPIGGDATQGSPVMATLVAPPYRLKLQPPERQALAERARWRVGVPQQASDLGGVDLQGQPIGMASGVLQLLAQRLGVVIEWVPMGNPSPIQALRSGVDWLALGTYTPVLARSLAYSVPWLELPNVLVGRDDGPLFWGLDSLRGKRLAVSVLHPLRDEIRVAHPGIQWVDAANGEEALGLVASGKADAALDIKPTTQRVLGSEAGRRLRALGDVTAWPAQYRFAAADTTRALVPVLDAALSELGAEQRLALTWRWVARDLPGPPVQSPWAWTGWAMSAATAAIGALLGVALFGFWRARGARRAAAVSDGESTHLLTVIDSPGDSADHLQPEAAAPRPVSGDQAQAAADSEIGSAVPKVKPQPAASLPEVSVPTPPSIPSAHEQGLVLAAVLAGVVNDLRPAAQAKNLHLAWMLDEALPEQVLLDPVRFRQMLMILAGQAIGHTEAGRVLLRARLDKSASGRSYLVLDVLDTGLGLSPQDQQQLLGRQISPTPASDGTVASATSLGLRLCRRLVTSMGGRVSLRNQPGKGSLLRVRLALQGAQDRPELPPAQRARTLHAEGALLLCDNNPFARAQLAQQISALGYGVLEADTAEQALALWQAGGVRALIVDTAIPGRGAADLVRTVRAAESQAPTCTALLLCASGVPPAGLRGGAAVDAYLNAPADPQTLRRTLHAVLGAPVGAELARTLSWRGARPPVAAG